MRITLFFVCILFSFPVFSQQNNNTKSPYTRYGYGKLADQTFGSQRGMGGIGYGLRNSQMINPLNPASYSSVDSMTFMLDLGLQGQMGRYKDGDLQATRYNAGLEYIAIQIPLAKGLGMGVGLEPVSYVGYQYGDTTSQSNALVNRNYTGSGGLSKVYATLSYSLFNRLSLGINAGYLFGDIVHGKTSVYSTANANVLAWPDSMRISGLTYEAGLQYIQPLGKNKELVFGAVYTPKIKIDATVTGYSHDPLLEKTDYYNTHDSIFQLPETYGVGVTYRKLNKWTAGADFQYQKWAEAKFYDRTDVLSNRMKINLGAEYIPNAFSNQFLAKMRYRAGANYADSYIVDVNGSKYKEYGVNIGFGIPMVDKRSFVNLAFEYSRLVPQKTASMSEDYLRFTLSYTFNELWFFKRKLQ
jgi:hypothetical protein